MFIFCLIEIISGKKTQKSRPPISLPNWSSKSVYHLTNKLMGHCIYPRLLSLPSKQNWILFFLQLFQFPPKTYSDWIFWTKRLILIKHSSIKMLFIFVMFFVNQMLNWKRVCYPWNHDPPPPTLSISGSYLICWPTFFSKFFTLKKLNSKTVKMFQSNPLFCWLT